MRRGKSDAADAGAHAHAAGPAPDDATTDERSQASDADGRRLVSVEHAWREYQMGELVVTALADASLEIARGELLAIVGPSGSGKSTLLNLIGGLDRPSRGHVRFGQLDLATASGAELTRYRRDHVGFVFQFYNLVPNLTAVENVQAATEICRAPRPPAEVLAEVGLGERLGHFPSQLSGGEQQRVSIARALAKNPDLLLCDEPTGALDFESGKRILRTLVDLKASGERAVVVITHNTALADVADRVAHLRSGRITEVATHANPTAPEEIIW